MAIPKRVRSNKRIVWHDKKFQVYQKDDKLQYQDKGIWKEVPESVTLLSYEEIYALGDEGALEELNKAPKAYYDKFSAEGTPEFTWGRRTVFYNETTGLWDEVS